MGGFSKLTGIQLPAADKVSNILSRLVGTEPQVPAPELGHVLPPALNTQAHTPGSDLVSDPFLDGEESANTYTIVHPAQLNLAPANYPKPALVHGTPPPKPSHAPNNAAGRRSQVKKPAFPSRTPRTFNPFKSSPRNSFPSLLDLALSKLSDFNPAPASRKHFKVGQATAPSQVHTKPLQSNLPKRPVEPRRSVLYYMEAPDLSNLSPERRQEQVRPAGNQEDSFSPEVEQEEVFRTVDEEQETGSFTAEEKDAYISRAEEQQSSAAAAEELAELEQEIIDNLVNLEQENTKQFLFDEYNDNKLSNIFRRDPKYGVQEDFIPADRSDFVIDLFGSNGHFGPESYAFEISNDLSGSESPHEPSFVEIVNPDKIIQTEPEDELENPSAEPRENDEPFIELEDIIVPEEINENSPESTESIEDTETIGFIDDTEIIDSIGDTETNESIEDSENSESIYDSETMDDLETVESVGYTEPIESMEDIETIESMGDIETIESKDNSKTMASMYNSETIESLDDIENIIYDSLKLKEDYAVEKIHKPDEYIYAYNKKSKDETLSEMESEIVDPQSLHEMVIIEVLERQDSSVEEESGSFRDGDYLPVSLPVIINESTHAKEDNPEHIPLNSEIEDLESAHEPVEENMLLNLNYIIDSIAERKDDLEAEDGSMDYLKQEETMSEPSNSVSTHYFY